MKNRYKYFGIAVLVAVIGLLTIACDIGEDGDPAPLTYSGTANGITYTLTITQSPNNRAFTPQNGDSYELTAGSNRNTGEVSSFSNNIFTLRPVGSTTTFTASISSGGIAGFSGSITWEGQTVPTQLPSTVTPATPPGNGGEGVTPDGRLTLSGQVYRYNNMRDRSPFEGNANVTSNLTITGGITNGQLNISIRSPTNNQLENIDDLRELLEEGGLQYSNITFSNANARFASLELEVGGIGLYKGYHSLSSDGSTTESISEIVAFIYVNSPLTVTGVGSTTTEQRYEDGRELSQTWTFEDLNLSLAQGWNAISMKAQQSVTVTETSVTNTLTLSLSVVNINQLSSNLTWIIE